MIAKSPNLPVKRSLQIRDESDADDDYNDIQERLDVDNTWDANAITSDGHEDMENYEQEDSDSQVAISKLKKKSKKQKNSKPSHKR